MSILSLSCSNKSVEKEMKKPMLFDTKEQAEKEAYKFDCEGSHQMLSLIHISEPTRP